MERGSKGLAMDDFPDIVLSIENITRFYDLGMSFRSHSLTSRAKI